MAATDVKVKLGTLQLRASSTPGYLPATLADREPFVQVADGFMVIGEAGVGVPSLKRLPLIEAGDLAGLVDDAVTAADLPGRLVASGAVADALAGKADAVAVADALAGKASVSSVAALPAQLVTSGPVADALGAKLTNGGTGDVSGMSVLPTGATLSRKLVDRTRDAPNVYDYRASDSAGFTGTADDTAALQAALNDVVTTGKGFGQRILLRSPTGKASFLGPITNPRADYGNLIDLNGTLDGNGNVITSIGTGDVVQTYKRGMILSRDVSAAADAPIQDVRYTVTDATGTNGNVRSPVRVRTILAPGSAPKDYVWNFLAVIDNSATGSTGNHTVGYFQGNRKVVGAEGMYGVVVEMRDTTYEANPTKALVAAEIDVSANGTDNNNQRLGIDLKVQRGRTFLADGTTLADPCYAFRGYRVSANGGATAALLKQAFTAESITITDAAIDVSAATYAAGAVPLRLPADKPIALTAAGTRLLTYSATGTGLTYGTGSAGAITSTLFKVFDTGTLFYNGGLRDGQIAQTGAAGNGFSYTIPADRRRVRINNSATIASGTIIFPNKPPDQSVVTISAPFAVTAVTWTPGTGDSVVGAPSGLAANAPVKFVYVNSNSTWMPDL